MPRVFRKKISRISLRFCWQRARREARSEDSTGKRRDRREISRLRRPTSRRSEREEKSSACSARNDSFGFGDSAACCGACGGSVEPSSAAGFGAGNFRAAAQLLQRAAKLDDVLRRLRGASFQCAGSDQYVERRIARTQVGLSDDGRREIRNDAACC